MEHIEFPPTFETPATSEEFAHIYTTVWVIDALHGLSGQDEQTSVLCFIYFITRKIAAVCQFRQPDRPANSQEHVQQPRPKPTPHRWYEKLRQQDERSHTVAKTMCQRRMWAKKWRAFCRIKNVSGMVSLHLEKLKGITCSLYLADYRNYAGSDKQPKG